MKPSFTEGIQVSTDVEKAQTFQLCLLQCQPRRQQMCQLDPANRGFPRSDFSKLLKGPLQKLNSITQS